MSMASSAHHHSSKHKKLDTTKKLIILDRISNLPDQILCCILSFLTTREAVATSILSKRWQHLWTWVPNLKFYEPDTYNDEMTFEDVINKVLAARQTPIISSFHVQWVDASPEWEIISCLESCIQSAILANVEEIDFEIRTENEKLYDLPPSLFSCQTLTVLKLKQQFALEVPSSVHLPQLKVLHLVHVEFEEDNSLFNLIFACPVLHELFVHRFDFDNLTNYQIFSETLTVLFLDHKYVVETLSEQLLLLDTPSLKYLTQLNPCFLQPPIQDLENLEYAIVSVRGRTGKSIPWVHLQHNLYHIRLAKSLRLDASVVKTLSEHISDFQCCTFAHLVTLKVDCFQCSSAFTDTLLHNSPQLNSRKKTVHNRRNPLSEVPQCLTFHLTNFHLQGFEGNNDDMGFLRYIFNHSKVMLECRLYHARHLELRQVFSNVRKFMKFHMGSPGCRIFVDDIEAPSQ